MNSLFLYIESNGMFALLLLVLLINMGKNSSKSTDERLFKQAILLNILVLIADTGCWIFDGRILGDTLWYNKFVYGAYYILTALFVFTWSVYAAYKLQVNWNLIKKSWLLLVTPMFIAVGLAIASLWNECLFKFDNSGAYIRGELFSVHTAILGFYLIISLFSAIEIMLSSKRKELLRECIAMVLSVLFPVVGGILQTIHYGFNMAWTGSCISLVIMFVSVQNRQLVTDALTGVHNRGSFERHLRECVERKVTNKQLYLLMIDINKFKQINDKYGHIVGDNALIEVAKMLKNLNKSAHTDFWARYGGDEFVVLCWRKNENEIRELIENIHNECSGLKKNKKLVFDISLSVGWAKYELGKYETVEKFIAVADEMMYVAKRKV